VRSSVLARYRYFLDTVWACTGLSWDEL
jgi:hypothetical protein